MYFLKGENKKRNGTIQRAGNYIIVKKSQNPVFVKLR